VQNHGFASIGALSEQLGSQRFGTRYRYRSGSGRLDGDVLPVDLAANAASLGVDVLVAQDGPSFEAALRKAKAGDRTTVVHVETDPLVDAPSSESWWDVPVSEVATLSSTQDARAVYDRWKAAQRPNYLAPSEHDTSPS
jgi:3D-(3,5/4)-trihydroxycyclohexane-1,2-dione acylhydrolase (decyclizing)